MRIMAKDISPTSKQFLVEVIIEIRTPRGMTIFPGDHVLIDPDIQPKEGDMAIVGGDLKPWAGQQDVLGVAVGVCKVVS